MSTTSAEPSCPQAAWVVYVLVSRSRQRTYVGISTDAERRLRQHNGVERGGARATRAGRPWTLGRVLGPFQSRGDALRIERDIKRLRGRKRLTWVEPVKPRTDSSVRPETGNLLESAAD